MSELVYSVSISSLVRSGATTTVSGVYLFSGIIPPQTFYVQGVTNDGKSGGTTLPSTNASAGTFNYSFTILNTSASTNVTVYLKSSQTSTSNFDTATLVYPVTIPTAPALSSRSIDANNVMVFCPPVIGATWYNLEAYTPQYPQWLELLPDTALTPVNNEIQFPVVLGSLAGNYQYRARARNSAGYSAYSNVVTVTKSSTVTLAAPILSVNAVISSVANVLQWASVPNAVSYTIEKKIGSGAWVQLTTNYQPPTTPEIYNDWSVSLGNVYQYRVYAVYASGTSPASNIATGDLSATPPSVPNAPLISSSTYTTPDSILISWNAVTNATSYNLEVSSPLLTTFTSVSGDFNPSTINNQLGLAVTLTAFGQYQFRLRAKNSAGYSSYSNVLTTNYNNPIPTAIIPNPPVLQMLVSSLPNNKLLKWNKDPSADQYNIESSNPLTDPLWMTLTGDFVAGTNNDLGDNNWGINVVMGTQTGLWKYRIRAKNSAGYSNYSNVVSYTISDTEPPPPVSNDKTLLSIVTRLFAMGTGLTMLVSKK